MSNSEDSMKMTQAERELADLVKKKGVPYLFVHLELARSQKAYRSGLLGKSDLWDGESQMLITIYSGYSEYLEKA